LKGCADGPRAVLEASANVETFDEEAEWCADGHPVFTAPAFPDTPAPADLPGRLRDAVAPWARAGRFTVTLGGEHAVTLGPVLAYRDAAPDLSVLVLDAHADLRDEYEGSPFSHACVSRRVQEHCPVVQAGVRSLSAEEWDALPGLNVRTFFRRDTRPLTDETVDAILGALTDRVYLSVDVDAFDPAFAPATGTPEPGGFDWEEVSRLVRALALRKTLVAMDVTEVKPVAADVRTEFLAARLILRTLAWVSKGEKG
jgi:agmatinase